MQECKSFHLHLHTPKRRKYTQTHKWQMAQICRPVLFSLLQQQQQNPPFFIQTFNGFNQKVKRIN